jgi:hypothetical protein
MWGAPGYPIMNQNLPFTPFNGSQSALVTHQITPPTSISNVLFDPPNVLTQSTTAQIVPEQNHIISHNTHVDYSHMLPEHPLKSYLQE